MNDAERREATSIKVSVPEGKMYVIISEFSPGHIDMVEIHIGKCGSLLSAWCDAVGRLITLALRSGQDVTQVIEELSGLSSDRIVPHIPGIVMRSAPHGIAYCLLRYTQYTARRLRMEIPEDVDHGSIDPS